MHLRRLVELSVHRHPDIRLYMTKHRNSHFGQLSTLNFVIRLSVHLRMYIK